MEVVIVAGGMSFGPNTLDHKSLGGSEQAALLAAKEIAKRGHHTTVFCNLPPEGRPDHVTSGYEDEDGVRWVTSDAYPQFITNTEVDLLIVQRDFRLLNLPHQAKKAVLWCHDLATHSWTVDGFNQLGHTWNEVWAVSEFHRRQINQVTGYPLNRIRATRNGILPVETVDMGPRNKKLLYAARPERGLVHLVKPGGIMERLLEVAPEFVLQVCFYDNFPTHMRDFYQQLFERCKQLPNVELLGPQTQRQLRQIMRNSYAYVYCTDFEETSCLLARECMEQRLPIIYSPAGALPETIGEKCGVRVDGEMDEATYDKFVKAITKITGKQYGAVQHWQGQRDDLYWDSVVRQWLRWGRKPARDTLFSRAWSLVEDSDVVPAIALLEDAMGEDGPQTLDWASQDLYCQLVDFYPFLFGECTLEEHYDRYYKDRERPKTGLQYNDVSQNSRYRAVKSQLEQLPPGSKVLDYACGEASYLITLAKDLPHLEFWGVDISEDEVECAIRNAADQGVPVGESNIKAIVKGSFEDKHVAWQSDLPVGFDAAMMNEVLEHVYNPWHLAWCVEQMVKPGGRVVLTVPYGAWELVGCRQQGKDQFPWRAHVWHLDKAALRHMFRKKKGNMMLRTPVATYPDGRAVGNTIYSYTADHEPVQRLDPLKKARAAHARQTVGAAVICMNDQSTVLRMLDSIQHQVQVIQFAQGPSTDRTREYVDAWLRDRPWITARWFDVPKISVDLQGEKVLDAYGFEDARNASVAGLEDVVDWVLWIDTDEYVSGDFRRYLRDNAFDSYSIHQHHFTCDPRGAPAQIDRPARLFRTGRGFKCYGMVHEHFEKGPNGGPGYCHMLQDVDIGHTGYVNEGVRRDRFNRNFPLLVADRDRNPNRRLGKFLWFRDLIHRMRYYAEQKRPDIARGLALEAVEYYEVNREAMDSFGNGTFQGLGYYGEAKRFLGRGVEVTVQVNMKDLGDQGPGRTASFSVVTEQSEPISHVIRKMLQPEMDKRSSKYWR